MPPKSDSSSIPTPTPIPIVVVERNGDLRASSIIAYTPLELAKKCKFKTAAEFEVRAEWAYSGSGKDERFIVELWAREDGSAGQENKYEFPPPVDTILFFGACALVAKDMTSQHCVIPLTLEKWDKMYNFLFGGFDSLINCHDDDDNEEDELDSIPAHRKTKDGYLKDGFVVDNSSSSSDDDDSEDTPDETDDEDETEDETEDAYDSEEETEDADANDDECLAPKGSVVKPKASKKREKKQPKEEVLVDTSSELSEEAYEYFDD